MRKGLSTSRIAIAINEVHEFAFVPAFGIIWGNPNFKFCIAFMWLNIQVRVGCFRK